MCRNYFKSIIRARFPDEKAGWQKGMAKAPRFSPRQQQTSNVSEFRDGDGEGGHPLARFRRHQISGGVALERRLTEARQNGLDEPEVESARKSGSEGEVAEDRFDVRTKLVQNRVGRAIETEEERITGG